MGYFYLILTIVFETIAIISMKEANGMLHKGWLTAGVVAYGLTFYLLTIALKYLPMGYTNAVWAGSSTFLVYLAGILWYKEKTSLLELFFVACILVGIIGLNYMQKATN